MRLALLLAALAHLPAPARAHDFRPWLLELREIAPGTVTARWTAPPEGGGEPTLTLAGCRAEGGAWTCPEGLADRVLHISDLPVGGRVLLRAEGLGGAFSTVLYAASPRVRIPLRLGGAPAGVVLARYLRLGVEHLLGGADHLLFVLALFLLLAPSLRRTVLALTAFTLGHSLSLALVLVGGLRLPAAPVEAAIALSLVLLAREVARAPPPGAPETWTRRWPALAALAFGLLHGLGFAGALAELGVPGDRLLWALAAFNGGVELGQLALVLALAAGLLALRRAPRLRAVLPGALAHGVGALGAFFLVARLPELWS